MTARRFASAIALALAVGPAVAGSLRAATADDASFARVLGLLGAQTHRRARFAESQRLAILDRPLASSGELIYDAPDHLEERVLKPRRESLIVTGDRLVLDRGGRRRTLSLRSVPQIAPLIDGLRDTLAGDRAALERRFEVRFTGGVDRWILRLTPKAGGVARKIARIRIEGAGDDLSRVEILETDGDASTMTITDENR